MKYYGDYHTHTYYSDGVSSCRDNVQSAVDKGLQELAFTEHGFANPARFAMTPEKFKRQRLEIDALQKEFGDKIKIYHGIEADILAEDGTIDLTPDQMKDIEVLVMGYHSFAKALSFADWRKIFLPSYLRILYYPSKATIARNTKMLIASIKRYPIDILAHINHLFKVDCYEVAKAAADYGTLIELNAKHFDFSAETFAKMQTTNVEFIVNSDAHFCSRIGGFDAIEKFLTENNFDRSKIVNFGKKPTFKKR